MNHGIIITLIIHDKNELVTKQSFNDILGVSCCKPISGKDNS